MDQLAKMLSKKVGITEDQAEQAIEFVLEFVKEKVPAQFAPLIDHLLDDEDESGDSNSGLDLGDAANLLGGLFGKK